MMLVIIFLMRLDQLHYEIKKIKKGIYGNASSKEIKELNDEGIETTVIPWIKDKEN